MSMRKINILALVIITLMGALAYFNSNENTENKDEVHLELSQIFLLQVNDIQ